MDEFDDCQDIDFAALDAIEAHHLASKACHIAPEGANSHNIWAQPAPAAGHTAHSRPSASWPTPRSQQWPGLQTRDPIWEASVALGPPQENQIQPSNTASSHLQNHTNCLQQQQTAGTMTEPAGLDEGFADFDWAEFDMHCRAADEAVELPPASQVTDIQPVQPHEIATPAALTVDEAVQHDSNDQSASEPLGSDKPLLVECRTANKGIKVHRKNAEKWVYPKEVPERLYQIEIIRTALLHNTLVCLPTGLGKTLVAAVVMHNFVRWFPEGKVVFIAPTRPLVDQQIEACRKFMGMAEISFHVMTGRTATGPRQEIWATMHKRVLFCTPQVFRNDVCTGICPIEYVTCIVVDECHRATGNADIVKAVKHLLSNNLKFRVVGLSATPGGDRAAVQEVVKNLAITRMEVREEGHPDVLRHVHPRHNQVIRVPFADSELADPRRNLLILLRGVISELIGLKAYYSNVNPESVTAFTFLQSKERFTGHKNETLNRLFRQGQILADIRTLVDQYGADAAHKLLISKQSDPAVQRLQGNQIFQLLKRQLEGLSKRATGHPKMAALEKVVLEHFRVPLPGRTDLSEAAPEQDKLMRPGRVIIFTSYRESVQEIVSMLQQHAPLIKSRAFIGQAKSGGKQGSSKQKEPGMKQREQKEVLEGFRNGDFNTLVSTCIGEEGLDIPQVEKVICYDVAVLPIRTIQRAGRTGRHEEGVVVHIVSEGREEQKYTDNLTTIPQLYAMLRSQNFDFYDSNPRMLPRQFNPPQLNVSCEPESPVKQPPSEGSKGGRGDKPGTGGGRCGAESRPVRGRGRGQGCGRGGSAGDAATDGQGYAAIAASARARKRTGKPASLLGEDSSEEELQPQAKRRSGGILAALQGVVGVSPAGLGQQQRLRSPVVHSQPESSDPKQSEQSSEGDDTNREGRSMLMAKRTADGRQCWASLEKEQAAQPVGNTDGGLLISDSRLTDSCRKEASQSLADHSVAASKRGNIEGPQSSKEEEKAVGQAAVSPRPTIPAQGLSFPLQEYKSDVEVIPETPDPNDDEPKEEGAYQGNGPGNSPLVLESVPDSPPCEEGEKATNAQACEDEERQTGQENTSEQTLPLSQVPLMDWPLVIPPRMQLSPKQQTQRHNKEAAKLQQRKHCADIEQLIADTTLSQVPLKAWPKIKHVTARQPSCTADQLLEMPLLQVPLHDWPKMHPQSGGSAGNPLVSRSEQPEQSKSAATEETLPGDAMGEILSQLPLSVRRQGKQPSSRQLSTPIVDAAELPISQIPLAQRRSQSAEGPTPTPVQPLPSKSRDERRHSVREGSQFAAAMGQPASKAADHNPGSRADPDPADPCLSQLPLQERLQARLPAFLTNKEPSTDLCLSQQPLAQRLQSRSPEAQPSPVNCVSVGQNQRPNAHPETNRGMRLASAQSSGQTACRPSAHNHSGGTLSNLSQLPLSTRWRVTAIASPVNDRASVPADARRPPWGCGSCSEVASEATKPNAKQSLCATDQRRATQPPCKAGLAIELDLGGSLPDKTSAPEKPPAIASRDALHSSNSARDAWAKRAAAPADCGAGQTGIPPAGHERAGRGQWHARFVAEVHSAETAAASGGPAAAVQANLGQAIAAEQTLPCKSGPTSDFQRPLKAAERPCSSTWHSNFIAEVHKASRASTPAAQGSCAHSESQGMPASRLPAAPGAAVLANSQASRPSTSEASVKLAGSNPLSGQQPKQQFHVAAGSGGGFRRLNRLVAPPPKQAKKWGFIGVLQGAKQSVSKQSMSLQNASEQAVPRPPTSIGGDQAQSTSAAPSSSAQGQTSSSNPTAGERKPSSLSSLRDMLVASLTERRTADGHTGAEAATLSGPQPIRQSAQLSAAVEDAESKSQLRGKLLAGTDQAQAEAPGVGELDVNHDFDSPADDRPQKAQGRAPALQGAKGFTPAAQSTLRDRASAPAARLHVGSKLLVPKEAGARNPPQALDGSSGEEVIDRHGSEQQLETPVPFAKQRKNNFVVTSTPRPSKAATAKGVSDELQQTEVPSSGPIFGRPKARMKLPSPEDSPSQSIPAGVGATRTLKRMKRAASENAPGVQGDGRNQPTRFKKRKSPVLRAAGAAFLDLEAGMASGEEVSSDEDADEDAYESDFVTSSQMPGATPRSRSEMVMYHRSLFHQPTPQLLQWRQPTALDCLPDTPLPTQAEASEEEEEDDDSFIDPDEGGSDHLLDSNLKGGQTQHKDECELCGTGGRKLLCCAGCPCAFHTACLGLTVMPPPDIWFCAVCSDGH